MMAQKIANARTRWLRVPLEQPLGSGRIKVAETFVVDLETDQGLTARGFGCFFGAAGDVPYAAAKQLVADHVAGKPFAHPESFAREIRAAMFRYGLGTFSAGMAAVDIALWDLYAKTLGVPVGIAMGGQPRAVPVYRTFEFGLSLEENCRLANIALDDGMAGVKVHPHPTPADEKMVGAVGDLVKGRGAFMVDSTRRCSLAQAIHLANVSADAGALWFEEPIDEANVDAYEVLAKQSRIAIATGEAWHSLAEAQVFMSRKLCGVVQTDLFQMGGLTECLRVARVAEAFGIDVAPHTMPFLAVHLAAAAPNLTWLEQLPLIDALVGGSPRIDAQGRLSIGAEAGLGLHWNEALASDYTIADAVA
jgi:L-alanine-DL-glutamate epimerase-like enolase superfamily enzyme